MGKGEGFRVNHNPLHVPAQHNMHQNSKQLPADDMQFKEVKGLRESELVISQLMPHHRLQYNSHSAQSCNVIHQSFQDCSNFSHPSSQVIQFDTFHVSDMAPRQFPPTMVRSSSRGIHLTDWQRATAAESLCYSLSSPT